MNVNPLGELINRINEILSPIAPAGVSGIEFISVFFIVYALMFILLERTKLFGENRMARLLIALAGAYFTASSALSVIMISKIFPQLGVITIVILSFIIVYSIFGSTPSIPFRNLLIIICIGLIIWAAWSATGSQINLNGLPLPQLELQDWYLIIFIILFFVVLILIGVGFGGGEGGGKKIDFKKAIKSLGDLLGGISKD